MPMSDYHAEKMLECREEGLEPPQDIRREDVDDALSTIYLGLIGKSWVGDAFTNFQDAWKIVEEAFAVQDNFDWPKERPRTGL